MLGAAVASQYGIERELGGGGMSRVFVAEEPALGRRVAIKVLPPELAEGITADRFRREIQLAAQLQRPPIVPLLTSERAGCGGGAGVRHGRGVAHRDIKPENILLSCGHARVRDFGVAKALREATPRRGGTTAGVYALGLVLYEMLCGHPPFEGTSPTI